MGEAMMQLVRRLMIRIRNRRFDADLSEELKFHEEMKRRELEASGATAGDARAQTYTIVGVARDAYLTDLEKVEPVMFTPATSGTFFTRGGPASVERIRAAALARNPAATVTIHPLSDELEKHLASSRTGAAMAWAIGLLGLTLAAVGVFGVFAYSVEERRREIGLRIALGAARADPADAGRHGRTRWCWDSAQGSFSRSPAVRCCAAICTA
jgi:hypothetical protein